MNVLCVAFASRLRPPFSRPPVLHSQGPAISAGAASHFWPCPLIYFGSLMTLPARGDRISRDGG